MHFNKKRFAWIILDHLILSALVGSFYEMHNETIPIDLLLKYDINAVLNRRKHLDIEIT